MSVEEITSFLCSLSPSIFDEEEIGLHAHIPVIEPDLSHPISHQRIITDFGKVLFSPENIPGIAVISSLTFIEMGINFLSPFLLAKLVQNLTGGESNVQVANFEMSKTALMTFFVATSALSQLIPTIRYQYMASLYANTLQMITKKSMEHLLGKSLDYFVQTPFNTMFTLLNKGFTIQNFGVPLLTKIVPTLVEICIACVILSQTCDMTIAISLVSLIASYVIYGIFTTNTILVSREKLNAAYNEAFETMGTILSRYKVMRDCNQLEHDLKRVTDVLERTKLAEIEACSKPDQVSMGHSLMSYAQMLFAVLYMGQGVSTGRFQPQNFILMVGYLGRLATSLPGFGSAINQVLFSYPDLKFVFSELAKPDEVVDLHPDVPLLIDEPPTIEFEHVNFCYPSNTEVSLFQEFSLKIPGGKKVAIVSESGFGKTSLFNLLYGYYAPDLGSIKIVGQDVSQVSLNSLQSQICVLGQNPNLFKGTIRENILYGSSHPEEMTDDQIYLLAESIGLGNFFESFAEKLDTQVGEGGKALSGSQQQKVSILRSFMKPSSVYLLDEATASLDVQSATQILEKLLSPSRKATVLMITHKLTEAQMADEIIVLGNGKVLGQGTHSELLKDCAFTKTFGRRFSHSKILKIFLFLRGSPSSSKQTSINGEFNACYIFGFFRC